MITTPSFGNRHHQVHGVIDNNRCIVLDYACEERSSGFGEKEHVHEGTLLMFVAVKPVMMVLFQRRSSRKWSRRGKSRFLHPLFELN